MKTAVVYYSLTGNTEYVSKELKERLNADLLRLEPQKTYPDKGFSKFLWGGKSAVMAEKPLLIPYEFHAEEYDRIIFGFPVWASRFAPPLRTFIEENRSSIAGKHFAVFACQSGGGAEKAIDRLKKELQIEALDAEMVLIDPADKPNPGNAALIEDFCGKLS